MAWLASAWQGWKRTAKKIGDVQARILLTLFYLTVLAPFALAVRVATDPLGIKVGSPQGWRPRPIVDGHALDRATRQY